eukprot:NODE_6976_length_480_cov_4.906516_g6810_i0.p2 GENE.NODE_6976_length_480_cov_4.906516_g6810_i0~~NODE_6976_length_480_cov_4.906516_g6810_i0.p2  ORF type:complete len:129 (-),score=27.90 NODE_6976_length_480_cov_4.906516_g6810_i0:84-470(-)
MAFFCLRKKFVSPFSALDVRKDAHDNNYPVFKTALVTQEQHCFPHVDCAYSVAPGSLLNVRCGNIEETLKPGDQMKISAGQPFVLSNGGSNATCVVYVGQALPSVAVEGIYRGWALQIIKDTKAQLAA